MTGWYPDGTTEDDVNSWWADDRDTDEGDDMIQEEVPHGGVPVDGEVGVRDEA